MRGRELNITAIGRSAALRGASAIRRGGISNSWLVTAAMASAITLLLVATGWAIARGHLSALFTAVAVGGVCTLAFTQRGAFIGVFVLASMNGIPYINTARYISGHYTAQDLAICALLGAALAWILADPEPYRPSRAGRILMGAAMLLLLWCLFTVGRTIVEQHTSITQAAAFARDYLYFGLLLLVLPRVRLTGRDLGVLLGTLTVGVCLFATVQTAVALGVGKPGSLIHVGHTLQQDGLTRVYSEMTDLVTAGLAFSLAASLVAPSHTLRRAARPVALLLTVSVVVQLTRARWIGLIAAFVLVSAWFMLYAGNNTTVSRLLRRRIVVVAVTIFALLVTVLVGFPGIVSSGPFFERITSIFSDIESGGGTVAVREAVTATMKRYLGGEWLTGLGFISPTVHYFRGLPAGSIEDPDLGVLNAVMPMGAIGAALIYLCPLVILIQAAGRSLGSSEYAWLRYGGAMWIVAVLTSSVTLVTLFSASGLTLAAILLTVLAHPLVAGKRAPRPISPDSRFARAPRPARAHPTRAIAGRAAGMRSR
jgi:hypothetical protein